MRVYRDVVFLDKYSLCTVGFHYGNLLYHRNHLVALSSCRTHGCFRVHRLYTPTSYMATRHVHPRTSAPTATSLSFASVHTPLRRPYRVTLNAGTKHYAHRHMQYCVAYGYVSPKTSGRCFTPRHRLLARAWSRPSSTQMAPFRSRHLIYKHSTSILESESERYTVWDMLFISLYRALRLQLEGI